MSPEIECVSPQCSASYDPDETGYQCPDCSAPSPDVEPEASEEGELADEPTCSNCDKEVPADANLCPYCGTNLGDDEKNPEIDCPVPDCDGKIPQGHDYCIQCNHERGTDVVSDDEEDETQVIGESADEDGVTVTFDIEGTDLEVIDDGDVVLETKDELPDNSFGLQARKAAANAGVPVDDARKVHRDHLLIEVDDETPIVQDNGQNPTTYNGESLSKGDRRELADGDEIELTGVVTINVTVE